MVTLASRSGLPVAGCMPIQEPQLEGGESHGIRIADEKCDDIWSAPGRATPARLCGEILLLKRRKAVFWASRLGPPAFASSTSVACYRNRRANSSAPLR